MPIREHLCPSGHRSEEIYNPGPYPKVVPCPVCGEEASFVFSPTRFRLRDADHPTVIDNAKDIWEGTPFSGSDGINPALYDSTSVQIDLADRSPGKNKSKNYVYSERVLDE